MEAETKIQRGLQMAAQVSRGWVSQAAPGPDQEETEENASFASTCMGGAGQPQQLHLGDESPPPVTDQGAFGEHHKNFLEAPPLPLQHHPGEL